MLYLLVRVSSSLLSKYGISPNSWLMDSRVTSSPVGPRPPVVNTMSQVSMAKLNAEIMESYLSSTCDMEITFIPISGSFEAIYGALVSTNSPINISVPIDNIWALSIYLSNQGFGIATESNLDGSTLVFVLVLVLGDKECANDGVGFPDLLPNGQS